MIAFTNPRGLLRTETVRGVVLVAGAAEAVLALAAAGVCLAIGRSGAHAAFGVLVAAAFFASGMVAVEAIARRSAMLAQVGALAVFAVQVLALAGLFDLGRDPGFDRGAFAGGVLAGTALWQVVMVAAYRRARQRVYDEEVE